VAGALKNNNRWEEELCRQIRVAGLPEPVRQHRFHPVRKWRMDLVYPALLIGVEVDGGIHVRGRHVRPMGYRKDCEKFAEAAVLGWRLIRVVPEQIRDGSALRWLAGLLAGAPGSPAPPSSASSSRRGRF
jgi:very-short-patch-repair endonuclease